MKKMKRVFCGALAGVMLLALAACGTTDGNSANTSPSPSARVKSKLTIRFILPVLLCLLASVSR